jgi:hypothetical protein
MSFLLSAVRRKRGLLHDTKDRPATCMVHAGLTRYSDVSRARGKSMFVTEKDDGMAFFRRHSNFKWPRCLAVSLAERCNRQ